MVLLVFVTIGIIYILITTNYNFILILIAYREVNAFHDFQFYLITSNVQINKDFIFQIEIYTTH